MNKILLHLTMILMALSFSNPVFAAKAVGTLMVVKGTVFVKSEAGQQKKATVGMKVMDKDTIITKADSRAKIVMIDTNALNISPDSEMNFEKYVFEPGQGKKDVLLNVLYGKVRANVNQKYDGEKNQFQVKTKAAVAGVRGTDFLSGYNKQNGQSQFVTFHGMVEVGQPGPGGTIVNAVRVAPGQMTVASVGAPPSQPQSVPANQLASMDSDSNAGPGDGGDKKEREPAKEEGKDKGKDEDKKDADKEADKGEKKDDKKDGDKDKGDKKDKEGPGNKRDPAEQGEGAKEGGPGDKGGPDDKKGDGPGDKSENGRGERGGSDDGAKMGDKNGPGERGGPNNAGMGPGEGGPGGYPGGPGDMAGRGPAGEGGPPMLDPNDLPSATGGGGYPGMPGNPMGPLPFIPPTGYLPPPPPPNCEFCRERIENGKTRLIISIQN